MEGFIGEHGSVIISGMVAILSVVAASAIVYAAGEMELLTTISVVGGGDHGQFFRRTRRNDFVWAGGNHDGFSH